MKLFRDRHSVLESAENKISALEEALQGRDLRKPAPRTDLRVRQGTGAAQAVPTPFYGSAAFPFTN